MHANSKRVMTGHLDHEADREMLGEGIKQIKRTISQYKTCMEVKVQTIIKWKEEDYKKREKPWGLSLRKSMFLTLGQKEMKKMLLVKSMMNQKYI